MSACIYTEQYCVGYHTNRLQISYPYKYVARCCIYFIHIIHIHFMLNENISLIAIHFVLHHKNSTTRTVFQSRTSKLASENMLLSTCSRFILIKQKVYYSTYYVRTRIVMLYISTRNRTEILHKIRSLFLRLVWRVSPRLFGVNKLRNA